MEVVIKKWGNSAAVRIPAAVMKAAKISLEQAVDVREEDGRVVIQPMRSHEYRLDELLAGITTNNCHHAIDTGPARGHEALQVVRAYVPDAGDVVWLQFTPQAGHEQAGMRPALVLSPAAYNGKTGLMLCCPITSQTKGYPFEVRVTNNPKVAGAILADQVKSLDWRARKARRLARVSDSNFAEVRGKLKALIGVD